MRIQLLRREAPAMIKLRRLGYSISTIARALGRSTSLVHDRIRKAIELGILRPVDFRKMPNQTRRISRSLQWARLMKWMPRWEAWILGSEERPP
jgi:DNA-binding Lrp family transcriptional regulator